MASTEPSTSRASIDTPSPTTGPIPLFDLNLRLLTDSYLSFFLERKRIEESYADSLIRLQRKIKSIDSFLDDRSDLNTARSAWNEVRDNVEREAQARQAFLNTLNEDVLKPLTVLKDTQERTRKRIKEDLKISSQAYQEYAEVTLPKLKQKYTKKFAEVEESKKATYTVPMSPTIQHDLSPTKSNPTAPSRPTVTSPQPLRPLDRRPSGSAHGSRNRSPSSSTAFSDLAHQGKRQLNSLMTFLDKGGSVKESLGGRGENNALRTVRVKRELEEADKEYRKGVHWLETLRLRRTKTLESGYNSMSMFTEECSAVVKQCLIKYTDNMTATTTTETQLSSHARHAVDMISPEKDVAKLAAYIPKSLASAIPDPILYENALVGECADLIFGINLVDYATTHNLAEGQIPKIVRICIQEIDKRGLEAEGIYRVSGRHAVVQLLQHEIERDEANFQFNAQRDDIFAVASLLKLYFRELPEPVFRFPLQDRIQHTEDFTEHRANNFMLLRAKMRRLHPVHQAVLKALLEHLARVSAKSEKNRMDPKNLAIVFGGVIFGEDEIPKGVDLLSVQSWKDTLMEDLITHAKTLFDDAQHTGNSPPLPPTPLGEIAPQYAFGSKTTKVVSVPLTPKSTILPQSPDDFTPKLPPRPANSIHPSARAATSPTKEFFAVPSLPPRTEADPSSLPSDYDSDSDIFISQEQESPPVSESLSHPSPRNTVVPITEDEASNQYTRS